MQPRSFQYIYQFKKVIGPASHKEKLVLQWATAITRMEGDFDQLKTQLQASFSEKELVDLKASISLINTLNRLRITLGDIH